MRVRVRVRVRGGACACARARLAVENLLLANRIDRDGLWLHGFWNFTDQPDLQETILTRSLFSKDMKFPCDEIGNLSIWN